MAARLFGVETEYALSAVDSRGVRVRRGHALTGLMWRARHLPHLPDAGANGMFLANGGRFYVDCGGHPELTTPECSNPWDVVRFIRAGDDILLGLTDEGGRPTGRTTIFRGNVDYSGSRATWGSHESYMHRINPNSLPSEIIPHLVSRVVYTGAGGFKNVSPGLEFTLSPRAAHIARDVSDDSTRNRGIFHEKDEPLCGNGYHRLHLVCGESLCSELGTWLRVGCTALVVALAEAGVTPGDGVHLRSPVRALRTFAADPTCTATVETTSGSHLTAIAIQRHYLAAAEAAAHEGFMPPWTGDVCRRWGAVLDALEDGWEAVATTLDWAIKRRLYDDYVRRHGFTWTALDAWTRVVKRLARAWARATDGEHELTADLVLGEASPIAAEVRAMTGAVERMGLRWQDLGPFLRLRDELFEIDTRFAQLGRDGIFVRLDAAGVLSHRVADGDDVARAIDHPPDFSRARLRGELVRALWKDRGRYYCDWHGVWDRQEGRYVDLRDPFTASAEWQPSPRRPDVIAERLGLFRHSDPGSLRTVAPIELNEAALALRRLDRLEDAERLLREAIAVEDAQVAADSPKRPHRRNNLAMVLLRAGKIAEAGRLNAEAWRLKAGRHDLTSGRILFVRIALRLLRGEDPCLYVGQLKTLLAFQPLHCAGDIARRWEIPDVLAALAEQLDPAAADLLAAVVEALNEPREYRTRLDMHERWRAATAAPLEAAWPEE